jgi:uncharacterized membrane protein YgcG
MPPGKYEGRAVVELLDDGRRVQLAGPFSYIDPNDKRWDVPKDAIVDGASIPRVLWTLIGGPFEGKYRNASIIHDWYCDLRSRPWKQVHRMFFDAMITSSVPTKKARLLYAGVYLGGPRWSKTVVENTTLATQSSRTYGILGGGGGGIGGGHGGGGGGGSRRIIRTQKTVTVLKQYPLKDADLDWLKDQIGDSSQSLTAIEQKVDKRLAARTPRKRTL